jgi:2-amino-4-hydroxy-6-hydroxymethyldihydropteridine diphosphokinase
MVAGRKHCSGIDVKTALIALGANLPLDDRTPAETVAAAMDILLVDAAPEACGSRLFRTPAFPPGAGPDFVNAAVSMPWGGTADALLAHLNGIEAQFGRTRAKRWEARIMDLDLIALGDDVLPDIATQTDWADLAPADAASRTPDRLIVPHPRLSERSFVLVPLMDVAPDWVHPVTGTTVRAMLAARPAAEIAAIRPEPGRDAPARPLSFVAPRDT